MAQKNFNTQKLGVMAGGQLGKMLAQAGSNWNLETYIMDKDENCPASISAKKTFPGDPKNFNDVVSFANKVDVLTLELENVNVEALEEARKNGVKVWPQPESLRLIKDKGLQKQHFQKHGIPSSPFVLCSDKNEIKKEFENGNFSFPAVVKLRTEGYDGRGVHVVKSEADLEDTFERPSLIEEAVDIEKEIAVIVARSITGEISCFPSVEMVFNPVANLVEMLLCPADIDDALKQEAKELAMKTAEVFDIQGVLAVEMFLDKQGKLWVNEVAPRPHNSGHQTIEGCITSQYEQHLRAIMGLKLGRTDVIKPSVMVNILGDPNHTGPVYYQGLEECMGLPGVKVHIYGKAMTKPFRKMGHATILGNSIEEAKETARKFNETLKVISHE